MTEFVGKVISNRMQKSVLVAIDRFVKHKKYDKILKRTTKLMAHDDKDECNIGDTVRIHSCRPLSKRKAFTVTEVLDRAKIFDAAAVQRASRQSKDHQSFAASGLPQQESS